MRRTANETNPYRTRRWAPAARRRVTADPLKRAGCCWLRTLLMSWFAPCVFRLWSWVAASSFFSQFNTSQDVSRREHERRRRNPVHWQQNKFDIQGADSLPGDFVLCRYWQVHGCFGQRWVSRPRGDDCILSYEQLFALVIVINLRNNVYKHVSFEYINENIAIKKKKTTTLL